MIMVLAAWFLHERITPALRHGLSLVAIAGLVLIIYDPGPARQSAIGVGLTLAGSPAARLYGHTRRWIPEAMETSQVVIAQQAHGWRWRCVLSSWSASPVAIVAVRADAAIGLASAVASGALYYAGAYWFYLGALRHVPASSASVSST